MQTETSTESKPRGKRSKKNGTPEESNGAAAAEPNGVADGAGDGPPEGVIAFPNRAEEEETGPDHYEAPEPDQKDLKLAGDVFRELQNRAEEIGIQSVIDDLIAIVDVHHELRTPEYFGSTADDDDKFEAAANVAQIARFLCRASSKIEINANHIVFYFRNHEKWTKLGRKVHASGKKAGGLMRHHTDGVRAFIQVNYHLWKTFNPRQKIATVYHALRELNSEGGKIAPDVEMFFEEPGLFGAGVHEETAKMARAFVRDAPNRKDDPYQLSLMVGIFDDEPVN